MEWIQLCLIFKSEEESLCFFYCCLWWSIEGSIRTSLEDRLHLGKGFLMISRTEKTASTIACYLVPKEARIDPLWRSKRERVKMYARFAIKTTQARRRLSSIAGTISMQNASESGWIRRATVLFAALLPDFTSLLLRDLIS